MKSIKGTKTEVNLLAAFAGESQARNRYTYFSSVAKKEGYVQISNIFKETADNEKEHAKRFFKFLEGSDLEIQAAYPAGVIGNTADNLRASAAGENLEWSAIYVDAESVAREEGFDKIADVFKNIASVEAQHEKRYLTLLNNIENDMVFSRDAAVRWKCNNCGYVHEGEGAPEVCPACAHSRAHFEIRSENY